MQENKKIIYKDYWNRSGKNIDGYQKRRIYFERQADQY